MSPFWWLQNIRYFLYFLREFTGPVIAFYTIYFLIGWLFDPALTFVATKSFRLISWITLVFAIIHTLTWFLVTAKISPLPTKFQWIIFILLILFWVFISYISLAFYGWPSVTPI